MGSEKTVKNYIYNTSYQILVLIAPIITTPYISRVLGVTNIGIYQYAQSIAYYFVLFGAVGTTLYGQREIAYLQDNPEDRSKAFWEISLFRSITTIICTGIYWIAFCRAGEYSSIYIVLGIDVIANAFDITWFFMGMEDFKTTVIRNAIIKFTGIICVFLFVKSEEDLIIYAICISAPLLIGNISLWFSMGKYIKKINLNLKELFIGIKKRLKPIVVFFFFPQVAMDVYLLLDKTMIGLFGSNIDQVGYYSQGQKIIQILLRIVSSLGTVMLPAMSASFARGDYERIKKSISKSFGFMYMLSFALMFGLCAVASIFVPIYFGDGYDPVTSLMIIISPVMVIIATSNILGRQYLIPTNQQKAFTISIVSGASINFVFNIILIHYFDAIGASIATVIAELTVAIVQCFYVREQLPLKECLLSGFRYAIYGAIMFVAVRIVGGIIHASNAIALITMILVGAVVYGAELLITKDPMVELAIGLMRKR